MNTEKRPLDDNSAVAILPRLMSVESLARLWSVKPQTLRDWLRRGKLPGVKFGALWLVDVDELRRRLGK